METDASQKTEQLEDRWYSVNERLPDRTMIRAILRSERVLVYVADQDPSRKVQFATLIEFSDGDTEWTIDGHMGDWIVTHWRPVTAPFKRDSLEGKDSHGFYRSGF